MRLLVFGPRVFTDWSLFRSVMRGFERQVDTPSLIISGEAAGVDELAIRYAKRRSLKYVGFGVTKQMYELHGNAAPMVRNQQMLDEGKPEAALAFPHPSGKHLSKTGSADMLYRCRIKGVPTYGVFLEKDGGFSITRLNPDAAWFNYA